MKRSIAVGLLLSVYLSISAQISFSEDPKITALLDRYHTESTQDVHLDGWRIKLVSTTNRREFDDVKYLYQAKFPQSNYVQSYENPYYSIKVGAYATRYDLEPHLLRLKEVFPQAIPFRDKIEKTELIKGL